MAIQHVAYTAMARLRADLFILAEPPFTYFPVQEPWKIVINIEEVPEGAHLFDRHMVDLVRTLNRAYWCVNHELWETWRCLNLLQHTATSATSVGWVRHEVLYGDNTTLTHDAAIMNHHFPPVFG